MFPKLQRPQSVEPGPEMAPPLVRTSGSQYDGTTDTGRGGEEIRGEQITTEQYLSYLDSTKSAQDYALEAIWDVESCPPAYIRTFGLTDRLAYQSADPQTQAKIRLILWQSTCRVHQRENPEFQETAYIRTMQILDPPQISNWYPIQGSSAPSQQPSSLAGMQQPPLAPNNVWSTGSAGTGLGWTSPYVLPSTSSVQRSVMTSGHPLDGYTFDPDSMRSNSMPPPAMPSPTLPIRLTCPASTATYTTAPSYPVQALTYTGPLSNTSASFYQLLGLARRRVPSLGSAQPQQPSVTSQPYQSPYKGNPDL